ncbi:hypothetical protein ACLB1N_21490 [Escherichia coli]
MVNSKTGVPAALVTAWLGRHGVCLPAPLTSGLCSVSMGVTRGKWGTLVNTLAPSNATMTPTHRWRR